MNNNNENKLGFSTATPIDNNWPSELDLSKVRKNAQEKNDPTAKAVLDLYNNAQTEAKKLLEMEKKIKNEMAKLEEKTSKVKKVVDESERRTKNTSNFMTIVTYAVLIAFTFAFITFCLNYLKNNEQFNNYLERISKLEYRVESLEKK
jgi:hypothetical protein